MKKTILIFITFIALIVSGCESEPPETIEDACGFPLETFENSPQGDAKSTEGLNRSTQTLTGYFGTVLTLTIFAPEDVNVDEVFACTEMIYKTVHQHATSYETFEGINNIAKINENPTETYLIDPLLMRIIQTGIDYSLEMEGLFDITLGPVLGLWDEAMTTCNEGGVCALPDAEGLEEASSDVGLDRIALTQNTITLEDNMNLELGGIAKGYAARLVGDYLRYHEGVHGYLINAGTSNIEVHGIHPTRENGQWLIALRNPDGEMLDPYARVYLDSGEHIVTSGDYQRYYTVDDEIYHHIIDPNTLYPGREMRAITIIGRDGLFGDVLSTAAFLNPIDDALAFVESYGYEAIIYGNDGTIHMSKTIESRIETLND